jgi:hypothetical protein
MYLRRRNEESNVESECKDVRALDESFDRLAEDSEMCDVEYAFEAQREAVLRDEYLSLGESRPKIDCGNERIN